jgi:hypothetical protein
LLSQKVNGFCSSIYDDAIVSINEEINKSSNSVLIIYSEKYKPMIENLEQGNKNLLTIKYAFNKFSRILCQDLGD